MSIKKKYRQRSEINKIFNFSESKDNLFFQQVLKNVFPTNLIQEIIPLTKASIFYCRYPLDYRITGGFSFRLDFLFSVMDMFHFTTRKNIYNFSPFKRKK